MARRSVVARRLIGASVLFVLLASGVASAGNGDAIRVGATVSGSNPTGLTATLAGEEDAFVVTANGAAANPTTGAAGVFLNNAKGYAVEAHAKPGTKVTSSALYATNSGTGEYARGVWGVIATTSAGRYSAGVYGRNRGTGGYGYGVWGEHAGAGPGVKGDSANGFGGEFTSGNYRGAYIRGGPSWIALYADGWTYVNGNLDVTANAWITGDLSVSGTCTGCTDAHTGANAGPSSLAVGDLVAIAGIKVDRSSGKPILLVRKATAAEDVVIGVAGSPLRQRSNKEGIKGLEPAQGASAAPGSFLKVIVGGLTQVRVGSAAVGVGDRIVAGSDGRAMSSASGASIGRILSPTDASGLAWALIDM